ncbi:MAG: type IV pilin protein [Cellvibrionaceae bacterium]|nr:type IV pilin protein [Cellvibrionaceae bacterium]
MKMCKQKKQSGFSIIEVVLVVLTVGLLLAIILKNYADAVVEERRAIAQQTLYTVVGLQERWFVRRYEYAKTIEEVGGADVAGDYYRLQVTQDPCGDTSCYTITAVAQGEQAEDRECEKMSINNLGVRRALSRDNQDTTTACWESNS